MEIGEQLAFHSREEWRAWLEAHHQEKREIWLVFYKSSSKNREFPLSQAVEEGLCYGWLTARSSRWMPLTTRRDSLYAVNTVIGQKVSERGY